MAKQLNLIEGNIFGALTRFSLPVIFALFLQALYGGIDLLIVGQFSSTPEVSGVATGSMLMHTITMVITAFAMGITILVGRRIGERNPEEAGRTIGVGIYLFFIIGLVISAVTLICSDWLSMLMHAPDEAFEQTSSYVAICGGGSLFIVSYNVLGSIFRGLGDSKTPFIFLAVSSISNILVDIWFVTQFHMGVAGVAWATFLCQGISCILSIVVVFKHLSYIKTEGKVAIYSFPIFKKIAVVAIPSILQQSFISIGNIVIQGIINSFGSGVIAGYAAGVKLNNLVITSFTTLGNGISNYTAQNIGANKLSRVKEGFKAGTKIVWILCIPIILLYFPFSKILVNFFMDNPSTTALNTGSQYIRILAPFYLVVSVKLVTDGILRGAGLMKEFMAATFTDLILRVILAFILSRFLGAIGIWCAWPIGWIIGTIVSIIFYKHGPWKNHDINVINTVS